MIRIVEFDTAIGTSNLGDEIILECLREEMKDIFSQGFTMRLGTHVMNYPYKYALKQRFKMRFVNHADYKFIMGTNLLTRDAKRTWAQFVVTGYNSWVYENSIVAGAGTTYEEGKLSNYTAKLYKKILNHNYKHSVRDEEAKALLEQAGVSAINTGCPTLWSLTPEHCAKIPTKKADRVVFSLSGYSNQKKIAADRALLYILKNNYDELIFWCQTSEDEKYLEMFENTDKIRRVYTLKEYEELLNEGNIDYVGTRLHGGVYALRHYVRSIVIAIDHRARGFNLTNNLPICERDEISTKLEEMINSELVTDIHIDMEAIQEWKSQFEVLVPQEFVAENEKSLLSRIVVKEEKISHKLKKLFSVKFWKKKLKKKFKALKNKCKTIKRKFKKKLKRKLKKWFKKLFGKNVTRGKSLANLNASYARIPIINNQIMFFTFQGKYTCNAKYISDEIIRRGLPWNLVWVTTSEVEKVRSEFPEGVKLVKFKSKEYFKEVNQSQILIDNAFNFVKVPFKKKLGQIYVETMHGSLGIKRIGKDAVTNKARNARGDSCGEVTDYCISNSTFEDEVFRTSFWGKSKIVDLGHARNDIFFSDAKYIASIKRKVCDYYKLDPEVKMVLYAPTFRNEEDDDYEHIDATRLKSALEERFGGCWVVLERAHTRDSAKKRTINVADASIIDATSYPDIQELMLAIDFGITDYSSWIYDYVLTKKPGLIYAPDLNMYENGQGFYYPITETPFPVVEDNESMVDQILKFDEAEYSQAVDKFLVDRGCIDDGKASAHIVDWLQQVMDEKRNSEKIKVGLIYLRCENLGDKIIYDSVEYLVKDILAKRNISDYELIPIDIDGYAERKKSQAASFKQLWVRLVGKIYEKKHVNPSIEQLKNNWRNDNKYAWYFNYERPKLEEVDLLIFCGGGIIKYRAQKLFYFVDDIMEYADENDIPVFMNSVGVEGYDDDSPQCMMLKNAINRNCVKAITTRDDLELLRSKYVTNDAIKTDRVCDPAFWSSEVYGITRPEKCEKLIGLNVARPGIFSYIDGQKDVNLVDMYHELIDDFLAKGYQVELFTNGLTLDSIFIKKLVAAYPDIKTNPLVSIFYPESEKHLVERISNYERILAVRLHASIVATTLGVPNVNLVWNEKQLHFGQIVGKEKYYVTKDSFEKDIIENLLMEVTPYEMNEDYKNSVYRSVQDGIEYALNNEGTYNRRGSALVPAKKPHLAVRKGIKSVRSVLNDSKYFLVRNTTGVKNNRIAIMTNSFRYTCNPKYIYEEIQRRELDWEVAWITDGTQTDKKFYPDGIKILHLDSLKAKKFVAGSRIWLDNGIAFSRYFAKKKGQLHIQTMHGSLGIKKLDNAILSRNKTHKGRVIVKRESQNTNFVITNSLFEESVFKGIFWKDTPMVRLGHARTDILFGDDEEKVKAIRDNLYNKYGVPMDKKIVMFGPTYRNDGSLDSVIMNYAEVVNAVNQRFGGDFVFLLRLHNRSKEVLDVSAAGLGFLYDVSDYPDMQELMAVTDVAITDYSSWIFDYVVTHKVGFIYATDYEAYDDNTGLCYPLEETPFPVCKNNADLIKAIETFDADLYEKRVEEFLDEKQAVDDGNSAVRIVDWLESII